MNIDIPPVVMGTLGAFLYVIWELHEWLEKKSGERIKLVTFVLKAIVYIATGIIVCNYYAKDGSLNELAAFQIGVSSPVIWRGFASRVIKKPEPESESID